MVKLAKFRWRYRATYTWRLCFSLVSTFRVVIVVASYIKTIDLFIDIQCLKDEIRRQNNWLTQYCHGINYLEGEVDLKVFNKTARFIKKCAKNLR